MLNHQRMIKGLVNVIKSSEPSRRIGLTFSARSYEKIISVSQAEHTFLFYDVYAVNNVFLGSISLVTFSVFSASE